MSKKNLELFCVCLAGFAYSANYTNHAPLASVLMQTFSFDKMMAGFLTTGIFATHALMQIPGGHLADTYGGKKVLAVALLIVVVGNFGISLSGSYTQLLFWKTFVGFGTGVSFVSGARYVAQVIPQEMLHRAQGMYGGSILLGSGFVIFAVPQLNAHFGWSGAFICTALIATTALIIWLTWAPPVEMKQHPHVSFGSLLSHGQLWLLGMVQMASFGLVLVTGSWITELLKKNFSMDLKQAGAYGSIVLLFGLIGRTTGGGLIRRLGYRNLLLFSLSLNLIGCLILSSLTASLFLIILAMMILGLGSGFPYAALFNRAVALFPGRGGAAMGLVNMMGIIMILAGAPLVGKIVDMTGDFSVAFLSLAGFVLIAMLASLAIKKSH
jgi:NNP family nitrate/nitrite transporter-like MFS transporter